MMEVRVRPDMDPRRSEPATTVQTIQYRLNLLRPMCIFMREMYLGKLEGPVQRKPTGVENGIDGPNQCCGAKTFGRSWSWHLKFQLRLRVKLK